MLRLHNAGKSTMAKAGCAGEVRVAQGEHRFYHLVIFVVQILPFASDFNNSPWVADTQQRLVDEAILDLCFVESVVCWLRPNSAKLINTALLPSSPHLTVPGFPYSAYLCLPGHYHMP